MPSTGERITWVHEIGQKRCLLIEAELSGTILSVQGDNYTIRVDSYDGYPVEPFTVTFGKAVLGLEPVMIYVFVSFGSLHTGKNLGCCIVKVESPDQANEECRRLGLMPQECNQARGYVLSAEAFRDQGMELNRFYMPAEMEQMGFAKG